MEGSNSCTAGFKNVKSIFFHTSPDTSLWLARPFAFKSIVTTLLLLLLQNKNNPLIHKIGCYDTAGSFSPHLSIKAGGAFKGLMFQAKAVHHVIIVFQETLLYRSLRAQFPLQKEHHLTFKDNRQNTAQKKDTFYRLGPLDFC